jgi:hypothetical protein
MRREALASVESCGTFISLRVRHSSAARCHCPRALPRRIATADDGGQVEALLDSGSVPIASFTADGAYDRDDV